MTMLGRPKTLLSEEALKLEARNPRYFKQKCYRPKFLDLNIWDKMRAERGPAAR
jgi:hypothetical protein